MLDVTARSHCKHIACFAHRYPHGSMLGMSRLFAVFYSLLSMSGHPCMVSLEC